MLHRVLSRPERFLCLGADVCEGGGLHTAYMDIEGPSGRLDGRSRPVGANVLHAAKMMLSVGTDEVDRFIIATPDRVIGPRRRIMQGECGEGETPLVIIPQPCETCENIK